MNTTVRNWLFPVSLLLLMLQSTTATTDNLPNRQRRLAIEQLKTANQMSADIVQDLERAHWDPYAKISFLSLESPPKNFQFSSNGIESNLLFHSGYLSADFRYLMWVFATGVYKKWLKVNIDHRFNLQIPLLLESEALEFAFAMCAWQSIGEPNNFDYARTTNPHRNEAIDRQMSSSTWTENWHSPQFLHFVKTRHEDLYGPIQTAQEFLNNPYTSPKQREAAKWVHSLWLDHGNWECQRPH